MGLFRGKIDADTAEASFKELYESMISESEAQYHKQMLNDLKAKYPILKDIDHALFNRQLTGANLALLDFAWNKYQISKRIDIVSEFMNFGRRKSALWDQVPGLKPYHEVKQVYTDSIMRTPPGDAFTEVAKDFFKKLIPNYKQQSIDDIREVVNLFRLEFEKVYLTYIENFKLLKLIR